MKCIYIDDKLNRCNIDSENMFCANHDEYNSNCKFMHYLMKLNTNIRSNIHTYRDTYITLIYVYNFINLTNIFEFNCNLKKYEKLMIVGTEKIFELIHVVPSFIIWLDILNLYEYIPEKNINFKSEYFELYKKLLKNHKKGNYLKYDNVLLEMKKLDINTDLYISELPIDNYFTFPIIKNESKTNFLVNKIIKYSKLYPSIMILFDILQINYNEDNKYLNLYNKLKIYSKLNNYVKYKSTLIELINIDKYTQKLIKNNFNHLINLHTVFANNNKSIELYKFPEQPKLYMPIKLYYPKIIKEDNIFIKDEKDVVFSKYNLNDYIKNMYGKNLNIVKDSGLLKISKSVTKKYNNGWIFNNFVDIIVEEHIATLRIYKE